MLKNQEFKAYGSIRKMKSGGACGVILALAMLGMAFSSTVTADEVNVNTPVAVEKKAEFEVAISHESLDKAMSEAKEAGVNVEIDDVQDEGVATSETVVSKQKEIEAELVILGTVGRTGLSAALLGNTAEHVISKLSCNLLAIKPSKK